MRKHFQQRDDLTGEYVYGDLVQLVLFCIFLVTWIVDSFLLKYSIFLKQYVPVYVRLPMAAVVLIIAGLLALAGLKIVFGKVREEPYVITTGVFAVVRHPIYLGSILLYLGLIFLTMSLFSIFVWIVIIAFYCAISRYEEKLLLKKFGTEYEKYMKKVPMIFPLRFPRLWSLI